MSSRAATLTGLLLLAATLAYSLYLFASLPERIPTHWNIQGQVDGWGHRTWAAFFGPGMLAMLLLMQVLLPWLSPTNFKVEPFTATFNYVLVVMQGLFAFLHVAMLQAALHPQLDAGRVIIGALCLSLALLGNVMGKVRRNFWMGFRTPWTLASDRVWIATHRLGARLMLAGGLAGALLMVFGGSPVLAFVLIMAMALAPVPYSLLLYKQLERRGEL